MTVFQPDLLQLLNYTAGISIRSSNYTTGPFIYKHVHTWRSLGPAAIWTFLLPRWSRGWISRLRPRHNNTLAYSRTLSAPLYSEPTHAVHAAYKRQKQNKSIRFEVKVCQLAVETHVWHWIKKTAVMTLHLTIMTLHLTIMTLYLTIMTLYLTITISHKYDFTSHNYDFRSHIYDFISHNYYFFHNYAIS